MSTPKAIARFACCGLLMLSVSCSSSGFKLSQWNPASVFKKKTDGEESTELADSEGADTEEGNQGPATSRAKKPASPKTGQPAEGSALVDTELDLGPLPGERRGLPAIVQPRQPSVEITPPTTSGRPVGATVEAGENQDDKGGLRPRTPTLDIVPPDRP